MIGRTISHYKILEKLGEGGMGVVYKALDFKLDREVALKFLRKELTIEEEEKKRFLLEAKATASLDHPNICAVHEIDQTRDGRMFIAMAFYEGETLKEKIQGKGDTSKPLQLNQAIDVAIQVAKGLQRAHEANIIHRDIKSANIIITSRNEVKIVDFGLAKLKEQSKMSNSNVVRGTVFYMSPEQAQGEDIDHRTDLWSLGVVLYEMITGELPFKGVYEQAIVYSILNEQPVEVTGKRSGIPLELERIINKLLEKTKEERYQHVDEVIVDLQKVKKLAPAKKEVSKESGIFKALKRLSRPIKIPIFLILFAIIAIGGYMVFKTINKGKISEIETPIPIEDKNKIVILPFKNLTGDKKLDIWETAIQECLIIDLYPSKFINVISTPSLIRILNELNLLEVKNYTDKDLKKIALNSKANNILQGSLTKAGDSIRINVILQDSNKMEIKNAIMVRGEGEESFHSMVDELTPKIKKIFNISKNDINNDIDVNAADISSTPEALKYFYDGLKLQEEREFRESNQKFIKAIKIDPNFASAYHQLSINYDYLGDFNQAKRYLQKALKHLDRVSPRERLLIEAWKYSFFEISYREQIKIYKELLKFYPDDEYVRLEIAGVYRNLEEWDQAIDQYKKILANNVKCRPVYGNLAYIYMAKGWYEKACNFLNENQDLFSNKSHFQRILAHTYILQGKYELALYSLQKSSNLAPDDFYNIVLFGNVYHIKEDIVSAKNFYTQLLQKRDPVSKSMGYFQLANLALIQGQYKGSVKEVNSGIRHSHNSGLIRDEMSFRLILSYLQLQQGFLKKAVEESARVIKIAGENRFPNEQKFALHLSGLAYLKMNKIDSAEKMAQTLVKLIESTDNKKHMRHFYHLKGMIAFEKNQILKSIEYLNRAISLLPSQVYTIKDHAFYLNSLAMVYYRTEDFENARKQYEKIISLNMAKLQWGDIYAQAFYWLGKIFQKKAWKGKALEHYEKFLKLWKNSDTNIHEVMDARDQLIKLRK